MTQYFSIKRNYAYNYNKYVMMVEVISIDKNILLNQ